jgi:hypothetical protein
MEISRFGGFGDISHTEVWNLYTHIVFMGFGISILRRILIPPRKNVKKYIIIDIAMTIEQQLSWMLGIIISVSTIITVTAAGIRWLVKHYFNELKPNGGGSLKDQVARLEKGHEELNEKQDKLDGKIDRIMETLLDFVSRNK